MSKKEEMITGGDIFIKSMLAEDVKYLFGIIGGQMLPMYDAIYNWGREHGIDTIMFRHEQGAAHAADAWARITGKPGICFGTVGPGLTHLVPGVATAQSDNVPVIAIAPTVARSILDKFSLQDGIDQMSLMKPITKYQKHVELTKEIPDGVKKVFRHAMTGRPGPVFLEISKEAFYGKMDVKDVPNIGEPKKYRFQEQITADSDVIKKVAKILIESEKPLIVAGSEAINSEASQEIRELSTYLKIPAITSVLGIGVISSESETYVGASMRAPAVQSAGQADHVLILGCKFSFTMAYGNKPLWKRDGQTFIQVDSDPTIIGHNFEVDIPIVGNCKLVTKQILEEVKKLINKREKRSQWLQYLIDIRNNARERIIKKAMKDKIPMLPERLVKEVLEFINEDAILVLDGGDIVFTVLEQLDFYKPRQPRSIAWSVHMGHLGTCIPYAIGAKLAKPNKQVVSICGDGSFLFNAQELDTAVRYRLPIIICIANNQAWGMLKTNQSLNWKKRFIDTDLIGTNYAEIAKGYGCYAEKITDPAEIKPALKRAIESKKPAVLDIMMVYKVPEISKLLANLGLEIS
ncbi:MAG: thiamine pyrophosphate-binding protein [Candidatus Lokiarchaeota archaeon]|nr:thiamine pyrophosphate-binding protein [Candidatus Lokiarchaeota archaeon]